MVEIEIDLKDIDKLDKKIEDAIDRAFLITCENIVNDAEENVIEQGHVVTGELAGSFNYKKLDKMSYEIFSTAPHAIFLEEGTKAHDIYPKNAKALHWVDSNGVDRFAKHVHVKGIQATPFFEPAVVKNLDKLNEILNDL